MSSPIDSGGTSHRCPACSGRGYVPMRRKPRATASRCVACDGRGTVEDRLHALIEELGLQMQRVADAMQAGDAERAAFEARHAGRVAFAALLDSGPPPKSPRVPPAQE